MSLDWSGRVRDAGPFTLPFGNRLAPVPEGGNSDSDIPVLHALGRYGLAVDNVYAKAWDFRDPQKWTLRIWCDHDWIKGQALCERSRPNLIVTAGETTPEALTHLTRVTGRPPLIPRKMLGYLQSYYGYDSWDEVTTVVRRFEAEKLPLAAIFLDLQWFGGIPGLPEALNAQYFPREDCLRRNVGRYDWSNNPNYHFENAVDHLKWLHDRGVGVWLISEPYFDTCTTNYQWGRWMNRFAKDSRTGRTATLLGEQTHFFERQMPWIGEVAIADVVSSDSNRRWYAGLHRKLLNQGVEGFWLDLGEPERSHWSWTYGEGMFQQDVQNVWEWFRIKSLNDESLRSKPNLRPFYISRAGGPGISQFPLALWSGDVPSRMGNLAAQSATQLNLGLSGIPLFTTDVGGFGGDSPSNGAQFVRWFQFGIFSTILKVHGYGVGDKRGKRFVHPYDFGEPYLSQLRELLKLRYSLIPYLYTELRRQHDTGMPVARAGVLDWPNVADLADRGDAYLFGPYLWVAPILSGTDNVPAKKRDVPLPPGRWLDRSTGLRYAGAKTLKNFAADGVRLPLFVREGAILPLQGRPTFQLNGSEYETSRTLLIFPGGMSKSEYDLYDDDGITNEYRDRKFSFTALTFAAQPKSLQITIGRPQGNYTFAVPKRTFAFEIYLDRRPVRARLSNASGEHPLAFTWDTKAKMAKISEVPAELDGEMQVQLDY